MAARAPSTSELTLEKSADLFLQSNRKRFRIAPVGAVLSN